MDIFVLAMIKSISLEVFPVKERVNRFLLLMLRYLPKIKIPFPLFCLEGILPDFTNP